MEAVQALLDGLNAIYEWIASGIYTFLVEFYGWVAVKALTWWYEALVWKLTLAWDVGSAVVSELSMASTIQSWLSALPSNARSLVNYARVPEAINLIATAGFSKIVLRFIA